jgi:Catechol dioxygenase N terminus
VRREATTRPAAALSQEFILLSDVLGLSMLTIAINAPSDPDATEPTVFGSFFVLDALQIGYGDNIAQGAPAEPLQGQGQVTDTLGVPRQRRDDRGVGGRRGWPLRRPI